jgi:DNA-binding transcriptional ArsR family regulator
MQAMMATSEQHHDQKVAKALSHPLRVRLLTILNESTASPRELATRVGAPLENVSYHVRRLAELGCIELVETRASGNAVEHLYRAQVRPFLIGKQWTELPKPLRRSITNHILEQIFDDVRRSVVAEAFDAREDRILVRVPLVVDEQGWAQLKDLLVGVMDQAFEIQTESAERLVAAGGARDGLATKLMLMHFLGAESMPEPAPDGNGRDAT